MSPILWVYRLAWRPKFCEVVVLVVGVVVEARHRTKRDERETATTRKRRRTTTKRTMWTVSKITTTKLYDEETFPRSRNENYVVVVLVGVAVEVTMAVSSA